MREDSSLQRKDLEKPPGRAPGELPALGLTLGLVLAGFLLLQFWRPFYFLVDDNFSNFSFLTQMGDRLAAGQYPYVNGGIYGGSYDWLRDPALMHLTHPVILVFALLTLTPLEAAVTDLLALFHLLTAAVAFFFLARHVRRHYQPELRWGWIVFLTLSYTFCAYAIIIGSSWVMYLANLASVPLIILGILQRRTGWGVLWTALGLVNALLMGHSGPVAFGILFYSAFAALAAFVLGSWRPLLTWGTGLAAGLAVSSPIWLTALMGFGESARTHGVDLEFMLQGNLPLPHTVVSMFTGTASSLFGLGSIDLFDLSSPHAYTLACFAAAWLLPTAVFPAPGMRREALYLSRVALALALLAAGFVARPDWLALLLRQLPVFHSLRWPFKELIYVIFFLHLWLLLRPWRFGLRWQVPLAALGTLVLACSLLSDSGRAPSLSLRENVRQWYLSGAAGRYWEQLQQELPEGRHILPMVSPNLGSSAFNSPVILVAGSNYGGLFPGVISGYGYSPTTPESQRPYPVPPGVNPNLALQAIFQTYVPGEFLEEHPKLVAMELLSLEPVTIRVRYARDGIHYLHHYEVDPDGTLRQVPPRIPQSWYE